jgi:hypothetical protein
MPVSWKENSMKRASTVILGLVLMGAVAASYAGVLFGPSPYLCFDAATAPAGCGTSDSPLKSLSFGYFHLETFEDHLFNVPGVTASAGGVTSVVFGPSIHDSVDADDGVIDGSGLRGDDYFSGSAGAGVRFTFDSGILGALPTHAGIVWTDGGGNATVTFQAFDASNNLLCDTSSPLGNSSSVNGETNDDRFFGCSDSAGIASIFIRDSGGGGIELDHLQYGNLASSTAVPAPATLALLLAGLTALVSATRRKA